MKDTVLLVLLGLGLLLLALGVAIGGDSILNIHIAEWLAYGAGAVAVGLWIRRTMHGWTQAARVQRAEQSEFAADWTPLLFGSHTGYIIEAAEKLGQARDTSAVPHLVYALEQCVDTQQPGWCDVGAALANALGRIGDRRALPLLYRLENVRGIGFIPSIRNAIAAIEPPTSLLRAGSPDLLDISTLLQPAHTVPDESPQVLLRSVEDIA